MKRRLLASLLDYCVVLGWLAVLAAVFVPLYLNGFSIAQGQVDLVAFGASVLPVWLYLTVTEARPAHATWGKRRVGLRVAALDGGSPSRGRTAIRNTTKLLPWQLAHLGVAPLLAAEGAATLVSPEAAWLPITASYALVGVTVAMAFFRKDHAALHDVIAGTRVIP